MANKFNEKKIAEGLEHIQLAEKCMKTSLFKWKPDTDGAIEEYGKAAISFKNAKAYGKAKEAYIKAAEANRQMNSPFQAAKAYEQAGLICKENKEFDEAADFMERASLMFQEHGTPDTAALCLEKAGKMVESSRPDRAIQLYKRSCDVSELEDRPHSCAKSIGKAARLLLNLQRLDEGLKCLQQEIDFSVQADNYPVVNKVAIAVVLVHLHRGDYVAADQFFKSCFTYPGFCQSEEAGALEQLLSAYDEGDEEAFLNTIRLPLFRYMDNVFTKLARSLTIPGGGKSSKPNFTAANDANDEDEFEGGLR